jgi:hypothetical protein
VKGTHFVLAGAPATKTAEFTITGVSSKIPRLERLAYQISGLQPEDEEGEQFLEIPLFLAIQASSCAHTGRDQ